MKIFSLGKVKIASVIVLILLGSPSVLCNPLEMVVDFCGEHLFRSDVDPEIQALSQRVREKIGYEGTLRVRRTTELGTRVFGYANASAGPFGYLIINEDFLKQLPRPQQEFLIGHELVHLKKHHPLKRAGVALLIKYNPLTFLWKMGLVMKYLPTPLDRRPTRMEIDEFFTQELRLRTLFLQAHRYERYIRWFLGSCIFTWYSRQKEKEADLESFNCLHSRQDTVSNAAANLIRTLESRHHPESLFAAKRFVDSLRIVKFVQSIIATHPSTEERIRYLEERRRQQE